MKDDRIVREIIDYISYHNSSTFDAIISISETDGIDVEDIVKMLDDNLLCKLREECIRDRKVLIREKQQLTLESLFQ